MVVIALALGASVVGALGEIIFASFNALGGAAALLLGVMVGGGCFLLIMGLQRAMEGRTTNVVRRLDDIINISAPAVTAQARNPRGRRRRNVASDGGGSGFTVSLARDLARADLKITVGELMVIAGVMGSLGALIGFATPVAGSLLLGPLLFLGGGYAPFYYVGRRKRQRQTAFNSQLADTLTLMSGALRSGYSMLQAMELVAREGTAPVSIEFDRVVREVGLGLSPEEALANLVERMQSEDLELMVTAINVQREVGGNLVEILEIIGTTIRERVKLIGAIRVLTAQQQFSGYIIAFLPVALALLLGIINPSYMLGIFTETHWLGWLLLTCSTVMIVAGFLVIKQIVNIRV